jgi:hypothetical protein
MGNACLSGSVNAPKKRGRKRLPPIKGQCLQCGADFEVSRRGNRGKKFCDTHCSTTYNMAVKFDALYTKWDAIEQCLCCHDKMLMKQEMSAIAVAEKKGYIARRRRLNGFDWKKVSSLASRANHLKRGTLVDWDEKMRRHLEEAWDQEWRHRVDCYYARWGHAYIQKAMNRRANWRRKYKVDPVFTAKRALRNQTARIKRLTKRSKRSNELLGCTYEQARKWIESQFQRGMSWSNAGEWEIDHIIPISSFDLTDERQVRCVNHYTNLRPLWAEDNRRKGDKIEREHQLALL